MTRSVKTNKPGRPLRGNDEDRRNKLLDAAETLFAQQGFSATSLRQIAGHSNSTPALVNYYFGSKKALLVAVMERVLEPLATTLGQLPGMPGNVLDNLVRLLMETIAKHPAMAQLIMREVMMPGGQMQQYFIEHFAPRLGGRLPGIIRALQEQGQVQAEINAPVLAMQIMGLCIFPSLARPLAEAVLGLDYRPDAYQKMVTQTSKLLREGVS